MAFQSASSPSHLTSILYRSRTFDSLDLLPVADDDDGDDDDFDRYLLETTSSSSPGSWRGGEKHRYRFHRRLARTRGSLDVILEEPSDPTQWEKELTKMTTQHNTTVANGFINNKHTWATEEGAGSSKSHYKKHISANGNLRTKKVRSKRQRKQKERAKLEEYDPYSYNSSVNKKLEVESDKTPFTKVAGLASMRLCHFSKPGMGSDPDVSDIKAESDSELIYNSDYSPCRQRRYSDSFLLNNSYSDIHALKTDEPDKMMNGCNGEDSESHDAQISVNLKKFKNPAKGVLKNSGGVVLNGPKAEINMGKCNGDVINGDISTSEEVIPCKATEKKEDTVAQMHSKDSSDLASAIQVTSTSDVAKTEESPKQTEQSVYKVIITETTTKTVRRRKPDVDTVIEEPMVQVSSQSVVNTAPPSKSLAANSISAHVHGSNKKSEKPSDMEQAIEKCIIVHNSATLPRMRKDTSNCLRSQRCVCGKNAHNDDVTTGRPVSLCICGSNKARHSTEVPISRSTSTDSELIAQIVYDTFRPIVSRERFFKRLFPPSYYTDENEDAPSDDKKKEEKEEEEIKKTNADVIEVLPPAEPVVTSTTTSPNNDVKGKWKRGARRSKASRFFHNLWHSLSKQLHGS